jgi:glucose/arabinose dehydrogenase
MKTMMLAGLVCLGSACLGGAADQPARSLFRTTSILENLTNPTSIAILPDGRLYMTSKNGVIKLVDPAAKTSVTAGTIAVSDVREDGLLDIVLDPAFAVNRRIFVIFGTLTPAQSLVVARFTTLDNGNLDMATRVNVITIPYSITSSDEHNTGSLAFDTKGNLYIGLADNTNNFTSSPAQGFSPRDPKRPNYDAQRSAANSNDLRGKILRIHPEEDGTYTVPAGNLFAKDAANTKPEIYTMGHRHPFRITVDPRTGWLFWAEPGPNATADDAAKGPRGYDEVNLAKSPGNYGWPYCAANNFCYHEWNYETNTGGALYKPDSLVNNSANNTGIKNLPAARPALVWYPYDATGTAYTIFGKGGANTSMLGQVYNFDPAVTSPNKIPRYFDKHLIIFDFSRSLIHAVEMGDTGNVVAVKRFWDQTTVNPIKNPIAMKVGPDGAFYFLGWGDDGAYPRNSGHGNLVKLDYTGPADPVGIGRRAGEAAIASGWQWKNLGLGREATLPPAADRAEAYDLKGERVWSWRRDAGTMERSFHLGAEAGSLPRVTGLLLLRYHLR